MSKKGKKILFVVGGIALTAAAFVVIPPAINKVSRKVYRAQNDTSDIDFDNMGPEVVRKEQDTQDED
jgi:hypothetical protein